MSSISSVHLCICFGYRSQREKKKKKKKTFKTEEKNKLSGRFQKSAAVFYGLMMDSSVLSAELIFVQNVRKATFFLFFCFFWEGMFTFKTRCLWHRKHSFEFKWPRGIFWAPDTGLFMCLMTPSVCWLHATPDDLRDSGGTKTGLWGGLAGQIEILV